MQENDVSSHGCESWLRFFVNRLRKLAVGGCANPEAYAAGSPLHRWLAAAALGAAAAGCAGAAAGRGATAPAPAARQRPNSACVAALDRLPCRNRRHSDFARIVHQHLER